MKCVKLYYNLVKQITTNYEIELLFTLNFIKIVKKNQS